MAVPDFQSLMLPVLRALADGNPTKVAEVCTLVAHAEGLTLDDVSEKTRGGNATKLKDRVSWSITHFLNAGLVERTRRAVYRITPEGRKLLSRNPARIDLKLLRQFPAYVEWKNRTHRQSSHIEPPKPLDNVSRETPEETLDRAAEQLRTVLEAEVLDRVRNAEPAFLERAVVHLLIAMGYGGGDATMGSVTGRSGDGGIDGTIREDALGLDEVYVQAKKYADGNTVGESDLRNFAGAIDAAGTTKGVFVTTADFTRAAKDYVARSPKRIVLIDGKELAWLMVRHGIGVRTRVLHEIKRIDEDYFDQEA
ncbi:MAG: restriction endonuclease [Rhodospirillaceae bacterium]|nr:restriction endonuclease [Rhodospirillaceae bacterium]MYF85911.1 restriction endonuclease [Rhodospirillaceae bacterium]MYH39114.1 restriction endonuclease [Rhodospirillaceae bacterium]MYK14489.1 restriction endonuclease [Rhodospirillaceae bacterium]MYK60103.1 restriction endonuclease [Rhodospirillaceae bacterium]